MILPCTILGTAAWKASSGWTLNARPLFIWMGEILCRTHLAHMLTGLAPFVQRLPRRLVHVNGASCGIFTVVSEFSAKTAAIIGRISLPELKKRGYDDRIAIGSLAGVGVLGLLALILVVMIACAAAMQVFTMRLVIAGIIPGLLMAMLSPCVAGHPLINRDRIAQDIERNSVAQKPWRRRRLVLV